MASTIDCRYLHEMEDGVVCLNPKQWSVMPICFTAECVYYEIKKDERESNTTTYMVDTEEG